MVRGQDNFCDLLYAGIKSTKFSYSGVMSVTAAGRRTAYACGRAPRTRADAASPSHMLAGGASVLAAKVHAHGSEHGCRH